MLSCNERGHLCSTSGAEASTHVSTDRGQREGEGRLNSDFEKEKPIEEKEKKVLARKGAGAGSSSGKRQRRARSPSLSTSHSSPREGGELGRRLGKLVEVLAGGGNKK